MKAIFESKVIDIPTLHLMFFENGEETTAIKRLHKLSRVGFIKKITFLDKSKPRIAYSISPKGLKEIEELLPGQLIRRELKSDSINHDLVLSRIQKQIRSIKNLVEFKTENTLQSFRFPINDEGYEPFRRLNSDSLLVLKIKERDYYLALEYEASAKESNRWKNTLLNYHLEGGVNGILYICKNKSILKSLYKIEKDFGQKYSTKVYFILLESFLEAKEKAIFTNVLGQEFQINFHNSGYPRTVPSGVIKTL